MTDDHLSPEQRALLTDDVVVRVAELLLPYDGRPEACPSAKLAEKLRLEDGATHPVVRAAIGEALRRALAPICANSRGYFIARDASQVAAYKDDLRARAAAIEERIQDVDRAWTRTTPREPLPPRAPVRWIPEPEEEV